MFKLNDHSVYMLTIILTALYHSNNVIVFILTLPIAEPIITAASEKKEAGVLLIVTVGDKETYVVI